MLMRHIHEAREVFFKTIQNIKTNFKDMLNDLDLTN